MAKGNEIQDHWLTLLVANLYQEAQAERHTYLSRVVRHIWTPRRLWARLARSLLRSLWHLSLKWGAKPLYLSGRRHSKNGVQEGWGEGVGYVRRWHGPGGMQRGTVGFWFQERKENALSFYIIILFFQQWGLNLLPCSSGREVNSWAKHLGRVYSLSIANTEQQPTWNKQPALGVSTKM